MTRQVSTRSLSFSQVKEAYRQPSVEKIDDLFISFSWSPKLVTEPVDFWRWVQPLRRSLQSYSVSFLLIEPSLIRTVFRRVTPLLIFRRDPEPEPEPRDTTEVLLFSVLDLAASRPDSFETGLTTERFLNISSFVLKLASTPVLTFYLS